MSALGGKARRAKGSRGEREFFSLLSEHLGEVVRRSLKSSRDGGADNENGGLLARWAIEVKRQNTPSIGKWWAQAVEQRRPDQIPALAYRLPRKPWRVIVPIEACEQDGEPLWHWDFRQQWTADVSIDVFAYLVRERMP